MNKILLVLVSLTISLTTRADQKDDQINTIKKTVYYWNDIHNTKSSDAFSTLYTSTVLFYGKYKGFSQCLSSKKAFLSDAYKQEIISPIIVNFYSSGTIKC